jgi:hypothetical protein
MASIKGISSKTGLSWSAVFMFALLLAFILYTASIGSLSKYKAFLFGPLNSSSSASSGIPQGQGTTAQENAVTQQETQNASNGVASDLKDVAEIAGVAGAFF